MRGVAPWSFVLLAGFLPAFSGLRLLLNPPPVFHCSQPGLRCLVQSSTCLDKSWHFPSAWTPSAPSSVKVFTDTFFGENGKLVPVLKIEWKVATDASITYLRGVELSVLQASSNRQICAQFEFQNNLSFQVRPDGGGRWNFSFNRFEVQPGLMYQVTVYHLPKLSTAGDYNRKLVSVTVPDCTDPTMKKTEPCVEIGSLWEPRINGTSLGDHSVLVSFDPAVMPASYVIHVISFQKDEKECKTATERISEKGLLQRLNVTVKLEKNLKSCCKYKVQIQPLFPGCATDCIRHSFSIPCPPADTLNVINRSGKNDTFSVGSHTWSHIIICILLVGSAVASAICLTRRQKELNSGAKNCDAEHHDVIPMLPSPPPLKPRTVWIVYSADHKLYVDIVLKFAQFMIQVCGTEVILDLLDEHQISEMGAVCWLTRQKQKMEALSSKIIILCSRGTRAKWQAMLGREEAAVHLKQDSLLPTGDMFTPALNLVLPDFKQPACFGLYLICYFEGISNESDIPDPFHVTSKYQLMDKFEEIYFLIQDLEKFEPGRMHQIPAISPEKYTESPCGKQLKEALQKFQKWQAEHPDWFKNECACCEDEDDLQSVSGELTEELIFPREGILKKQLLPKEPDPNSCCLVNLLVNEDDLGAYKLKPQLLPQEDLAFQTVVIPAETPSVQVVKPAALPEEKEILSHKLLTNEDWLERVPMIEASIPRRNNVLLQEDLSSDPQALPADMRQQLEGLMYSLYQQSIIPSGMPLCQESVNEQQQLVFDESCKVQRQSVQSDQGYISRCSSLPSDSPVEQEEEESQEQEGYWSADCSEQDTEVLRVEETF
ncbi:interleukin-17 receptor A isoform X2 [Python bivittatus]|uniref:Interleukin-17 receptor A isoform X2 n=1 Tax=Python bivittatus TaxID=176946 RepID=A0A9F5JA01_PYTBI|nr:interleukin-17 receptor A isoform X2 [Python bivittatus]XP_025030466.1 interleukin-17 receptor A isoform X2 [Python bivittatus]